MILFITSLGKSIEVRWYIDWEVRTDYRSKTLRPAMLIFFQFPVPSLSAILPSKCWRSTLLRRETPRGRPKYILGKLVLVVGKGCRISSRSISSHLNGTKSQFLELAHKAPSSFSLSFRTLKHGVPLIDWIHCFSSARSLEDPNPFSLKCQWQP